MAGGEPVAVTDSDFCTAGLPLAAAGIGSPAGRVRAGSVACGGLLRVACSACLVGVLVIFDVGGCFAVAERMAGVVVA